MSAFPGNLRSVFLAALILAAAGHAGEAPRRPQLAAGPDGAALGGYQAESGDNGSFELFIWEPEQNALTGLGRFNGQLAGLAWDPAGRPLALTRDGSLARLGDDPETLAVPDSRWNMQDLAWFGGGPAALHYENDLLRLAWPEAQENWRPAEEPAAAEDRLIKARLAPLGDELHLIWSARDRDFSRGALRHAVWRNGKWEELPPLALGNVRSFAVIPRDGGLELLAAIPGALRRTGTATVRKLWRAGAWSDGPAPEKELEERLRSSRDFAGAALPGGVLWLTAGSDGAFLNRMRIAPGGPPDSYWTAWMGAALLAAFTALMLMYCRRSRLLSRAHPGKPADLASRAAALAIDWIILSLALSAYHFAAGDMRIYYELLNYGDANAMFWLTIGSLALYAAVFEGLCGATHGKRLAGIRVRSALGGAPTFLQAAFRNVMRGIDMLPIVFPGLPGMVVALLSPKRQRVGDLLAATVVRRHFPARRRRFILASASPRRRELMEALGVDLRVEPAGIDENFPPDGDPEQTARLLAEAKAVRAAERAAGEVVVAADTLVVLDDEILAKPRDAEEAAAMLHRLSGRSHLVFTGVAVCDTASGQSLSEVERTEVDFRQLSSREIAEYVATGDPMDKAGAYGIQSGRLVGQIRGSLSNVAGLPMEMLLEMLEALDS